MSDQLARAEVISDVSRAHQLLLIASRDVARGA